MVSFCDEAWEWVAMSYLSFSAPLFTNAKNTIHRCILVSKNTKSNYSLALLPMF